MRWDRQRTFGRADMGCGYHQSMHLEASPTWLGWIVAAVLFGGSSKGSSETIRVQL